MTAKTTITDQQRNRIKELLEKLPTIDQATIAKACDEFEKWVAAELILKNDPIYLNMLMVVAHQYALKNNPDKAIEFLKIILAQAHKEGNLPMMIRARNNKALVYTSLGKHFEALRQWEELLKMNIPASSRITLLTNMGVTYGKTGQFQKAIKSHFQALELVHEEEQSEVQGDVYINLGNVFRTSGEKQRAIEYYTKAVDIYELSSNKQKLSLAYNNLCGVYNEIEDFEMAERFGCQALELYRIFQHPRELSLVLNNVGATREQQGKYTEAFELYNEALDVASKFNDISMQINILNNLTLLFTEQKSHERAVEYALKTIPLLEEPYHLESAKVTYSLLASAYKELGDLEKAYQSLEKSVEIFSKVADNNPKLFVAREETEFFRHKLE
ncbi:MAG: tetratricopeptide repeat protein, partial [Candidatus Cloacimonetes bacterium]|nr:tetratricopeptide repeat protein [Candidatus Cloacimonadota bacterium]